VTVTRRPPHSIAAAVIVLAISLAFTITSCSSSSSSQSTVERQATSSTTASTVAGPPTTLEPEAGVGRVAFVYGPVVGECVDHRSVASGRAVTVSAVPTQDGSIRTDKDVIFRLSCDLPHQYEVIAAVEAGLPADPPPATETLVAVAKKSCPAAFATYVGVTYSRSALEVGWILPTQEQRTRGVQTIGCTAFDPNGKLTGSVRDSNR